MAASGLTYAYLNALVMLMQPFIVALTERALFGGRFPAGLWPLLACTCVGSACVIGAQSRAVDAFLDRGDTADDGDGGGASSSRLTSRDVIGMLLQLISIFCSTGGRLTVRAASLRCAACPAMACRRPPNCAALPAFCRSLSLSFVALSYLLVSRVSSVVS